MHRTREATRTRAVTVHVGRGCTGRLQRRARLRQEAAHNAEAVRHRRVGRHLAGPKRERGKRVAGSTSSKRGALSSKGSNDPNLRRDRISRDIKLTSHTSGLRRVTGPPTCSSPRRSETWGGDRGRGVAQKGCAFERTSKPLLESPTPNPPSKSLHESESRAKKI